MKPSKEITVHGFKVQYLAAYRAGKSQYIGEFVYQIEVMVDGEREVRMEMSCTTIKQAKQKFEWSLKLRREAIEREAVV